MNILMGLKHFILGKAGIRTEIHLCQKLDVSSSLTDAGQSAPSEKENLCKYLNKINEHPLPVCNWILFAVLVNIAMKKVGHPYLLLVHFLPKMAPNPIAVLRMLPCVDECNSWGDYFYMEALTRMNQDWELYW